MRMDVPIESICLAFPNLRDLVLAGPFTVTEDAPLIRQLTTLPKLERLAIGDRGTADLGLENLHDLSLRYLWLEGQDYATPKRACFGMAENDELRQLTTGTLVKNLREYVSAPRSEKFVSELQARRITHVVSSDAMPYEHPRMAQYSWRRK